MADLKNLLTLLIAFSSPAVAQTVWTNSAGLHTVSTCSANGETWEELGEMCHYEKIFRLSPSSNIASMTTSMISTIHNRTYTFEQKDDITAPELAQALVAILPALTCRKAIGNGCDPREKIEALKPETMRHFALHDQGSL